MSADDSQLDAASGAQMVAKLFTAFERRDLDAALALLHPEVRFLPVTAQVTREGRAYVGHDGIREYFADVDRMWEELELVPNATEAVVGAVVIIGEVRARGAAGEIRQPVIWTWKLRDGLVAEGRVHANLQMAREAAGLTQAEHRT